VDVSPKGDLVATSGADGAVKLWDLLTGKETASLPEQAGGIGKLLFGPDAATLAAAGWNDSRVVVWDLTTSTKGQQAGRRPKQTIPAGPKGVTAMAYAPDGKLLAVAFYEQVKLWDLVTDKEAARFDHRDGMVGLTFSPDGKTLYQLGSNAKVYPLDVAARQPGRVWDPGHTPFATTSLALSRDGKLLAAGVFDYVRLWDTATGSLRNDIKFGVSRVGGVALSPDGKLLATVSGSVTLWDLETGKELARIEAGQQADQALFTPDGARLVMRLYGKIKVYEVAKVLEQKRVP
jgi:WD40 repeat protein